MNFPLLQHAPRERPAQVRAQRLPGTFPLKSRSARWRRLIVGVTLLLNATAFAQEEEPSRLRCTIPDDWKPAGDGKSYILPGPNAAVTFGPSTPFAGTAEEWIEQYWRALGTQLKFVSEPESATNGRFLARIGTFQQAGGSPAWLCLNTIVQDGRGEAVVLIAGSEAEFGRHLPALARVIAGATVGAARAGPSQDDAPARNAAPAPNRAQNGSTNTPTTMTVHDYSFVAPQGWQRQDQADHILLTQVPDQSGCVIQILSPQASSGDLEKDAGAVFEMMYPGWQYQKAGAQQYVLSRGVLPTGLEYSMKEAAMSATGADGRYHLEEGVALVIKAGSQIAIVAVRHRSSLLAHNACQNDYRTWRRFFNSFAVKGATVGEAETGKAAERIVGVWSQSGGGALGEYVFAANGRYGLAGGLGSSSTSRDDRYEYLHLRSHAWEGDGTYAVAGSQLTLTRRGDSREEQVRFRFEEVNHGGTGWKERLWLLKKDGVGEVEVGYEKKE